MMRKKLLEQQVVFLRFRVEELEHLICPGGHDWFEDYWEQCMICKRCGKVGEEIE